MLLGRHHLQQFAADRPVEQLVPRRWHRGNRNGRSTTLYLENTVSMKPEVWAQKSMIPVCRTRPDVGVVAELADVEDLDVDSARGPFPDIFLGEPFQALLPAR